jgi:hypothetical protein
VYVNWTRKRACWHREDCRAVEMHGGCANRAKQEWIMCESIEEVHHVLREKAMDFPTGEVRPCARCRPDEGWNSQ